MMWFVYAFLSCLSWTGITIFGKLASARVDAFLLTTLRAVLMSIIMVFWVFVSKKISFDSCYAIEVKDWSYIALMALFSAAAWMFYFTAFNYGLMAKVVSIDRLNFVLIILSSAYIFGEELTWGTISGTVLMVIGIALIALA